MDIKGIFATLLFILFSNKWYVWTEITDQHISTTLKHQTVNSENSRTSTDNSLVESETSSSEVKSTEQNTYTTTESTHRKEHYTTKTNIATVSENKTIPDKTTSESTTVFTTEITNYQHIDSATQVFSSTEYFYEEEFITLLLNITVTYCYDSMCLYSEKPPFNCRCDNLCYFYRDCCYSMIEKLLTWSREISKNEIAPLINRKTREVENITQMLTKNLIACVGNEFHKSAFIMVSRCDDVSFSSKDVIEKCDSSTKMYSIRNIPVDYIVDEKVVATYINVYCALCNGVSENETEFWTVDISCNVENVEVISQMELEEIEKLEECVVRPLSTYKDSLRKCYIGENYIESCDQSTNEIKSLCQSYVYPGKNGDLEEMPIYKNPHCASCHDKNMDVYDFHCVILRFDDPKFKPDVADTPVNLQVVFDFSREKGLVPIVQCVELVKCETNEIYDCASKRCRQLYCLRGETPLEGKCIKHANVASGFTRNPVVETFKPIDRSVTGVIRLGITENYILELLSNKYANLVLYEIGETSDTILKKLINAIDSIYGGILESNQMEECPCVKIKRISKKYDIIIELFPRLVLYFNNLEERDKPGYSLIPFYMKIRNFLSLDNLECATGELIMETKPFVVTADSSASSNSPKRSFFLPSYHVVVYEQNSMWEVIYNARFGIVPEVVATCNSRPILNCSMIAYGMHEVEFSNTSVEIISTSLTFQEKDFVIFQNKVFVCSNRIYSSGSFVNIFDYAANHRIISLVTSAISAFSASIVVVAHCCVKRLRNIHGLNLSALSVSTVLMHLLLLASSFIEGQTLCVIYAAALHVVILDVFAWMNIIGFDMTRSLSSDRQISHSSPYKRFLGYIFLSFAFPILIMTVSVSLDFTESRFKPDYGQNGVCWLSNSRSILMFVIGPIAVSLLLNFGFVTFTIKAIYSKAKQSKFARDRSYFVVYIKLSLILGLTWIFGIVGAVAELEWLWIVHIVINGLHGFSLMICSLVNVRMLRQLRNSMKTSTQNSNYLLQKTAPHKVL